MHKPNNLLEADVKDELDWDHLVDNSRIEVKADDGMVTLTGAVPTLEESLLAADDARSVSGVRDVDNELNIGLLGEAIADADIAAACADALDRDKFVPKGSTTATVLNGWVTLTGRVRHHLQRKAAEHAVGGVRGVLGVDNDITLTDEPIPSDVVDRINMALQRSAIVDDSTIQVSNQGHIIYLDGVTDSWAAKNEAEDAAWSAPGVSEVVDRLSVVV
jgi:osmotically-inducible protein OsmY